MGICALYVNLAFFSTQLPYFWLKFKTNYIHKVIFCQYWGAQWHSGRVLDFGLKVAGSRLTRGTVLCPWTRHCIICFLLFQPRKCPDMHEKLLTGCIVSSQTHKIMALIAFTGLLHDMAAIRENLSLGFRQSEIQTSLLSYSDKL